MVGLEGGVKSDQPQPNFIGLCSFPFEEEIPRNACVVIFLLFTFPSTLTCGLYTVRESWVVKLVSALLKVIIGKEVVDA